MNQVIQTHVFTPLFASAVHPCPLPYARAMPKDSKGPFEIWSPTIASTPRRLQEEMRQLEEQKLLEQYGELLHKPIENPTYEIDSTNEECVQRLLELMRQMYQETGETSFLLFENATNVNHDLSAIVKPKEES